MRASVIKVPETEGAVIELRRDSLSFPATLAQSIANIAPTVTPAMALPLVVANATNGTWFVFLIATLGLMLVGLNISVFARRVASAGSLYTYVGQSLGDMAGFLSGWGMLVAYLFTGMATLIGYGIFAEQLLIPLGIHVPVLVVEAIGAALIWYLAYRDIRLSSLLAMGLELISVSLIALLGLVVLVKTGVHVDFGQITLKGVTPFGVQAAMVLAVFSFVGFESSATLGKEARNPFRSIPRAVIVSTLAVGIFFSTMAYVEVMSFPGGVVSLANSTAPLSALAGKFHVGAFGWLINIGATLSFFSCTLASVNAASRVKFAMSRDNILHNRLSRVHATNRTPHIAVTVSAMLNFAVPALMSGLNPLDAYGYLGTVATYGFLLVYILVSVASSVFMAKRKQLQVRHVLMSVGGVVFMTIPLIGSVYPIPPAPYNWLPYAFISYLVVGALWFKWIVRSSATGLVAKKEFDLKDELAVD